MDWGSHGKQSRKTITGNSNRTAGDAKSPPQVGRAHNSNRLYFGEPAGANQADKKDSAQIRRRAGSSRNVGSDRSAQLCSERFERQSARGTFHDRHWSRTKITGRGWNSPRDSLPQ